MRIVLAFTLLASTAFAGGPPVPAPQKEPAQLTAIRAALPSYVRVPQRQLESKKFQRFIASSNRDEAYTTYELSRAYNASYNLALQAKTTYPGRTFVIRNLGSGTEYLKSPAPKK